MAIEPRFHQVEKQGPIVTWKFSNPPRNLASMDTGAELQQLVEEFENDPELRVGIITSATPGKFIQHFDVSTILDWAEGMSQLSDEEVAEMRSQMPETKGIGSYTTKPLICAINGPVEGGGCELALYCDFRFISRDAFMGQPEIKAGFPPGYGVPRLVQLLGVGRTLEICMTGRRIYPDEAERIGLVTRACEPEELESTVMNFALALASKTPEALASVKKTVYQCADITLQEGLNLNSGSFFQSIRNEDTMKFMRIYVAADQDNEKLMSVFLEAGGDLDKVAEILDVKK
ncbi:MAG: enoyl-CoA hydratase/isomerase family protein [Proteobacteria bacterium]|nr:enoyl-CoA hydratase/isomerase family protein [Pseudomonadota bacterium]